MSVQPSDEDREAAGDVIREAITLGRNKDSDSAIERVATALATAREAGRRAGIEEADEWLKAHDGQWCCCSCGPSKTSRQDWCDRGCGSDYNAMIRIDYWRMGRLFRLAAPEGRSAP